LKGRESGARRGSLHSVWRFAFSVGPFSGSRPVAVLRHSFGSGPFAFRSHHQLHSLPSTFCLGPIGGTRSADHKDGMHEMERAPAAITSLSAASRCASRPPSDPSV